MMSGQLLQCFLVCHLILTVKKIKRRVHIMYHNLNNIFSIVLHFELRILEVLYHPACSYYIAKCFQDVNK